MTEAASVREKRRKNERKDGSHDAFDGSIFLRFDQWTAYGSFRIGGSVIDNLQVLQDSRRKKGARKNLF